LYVVRIVIGLSGLVIGYSSSESEDEWLLHAVVIHADIAIETDTRYLQKEDSI